MSICSYEEGEISDQEDDTIPNSSLSAEVDAFCGQSSAFNDETSRENSKCEFCDTAVKYRCPGCDIQTCSLQCCKKHKVLTGCDGSVKRSRLIPMSQFDNFALLNDVRFLEEADRLRKNCQRDSMQNVRRDNYALKTLTRECAKRGCRLLFLPPYFDKSRSNCTNYDKIAETIFWKVRWIFLDCNSSTIDTVRIPESVKIITMLKQLIQPKPNSDYLEFSKTIPDYKSVELSDIRCFIKVDNNKWTTGMRYYEFDINLSLRDNLKHKILVEFPFVYVCLPRGCVETLPILSIEDKNKIVSKYVWEKVPASITLEDKFRLMQEMAKVTVSTPSIPKLDRNATLLESQDNANDSSTLKPLRRIIPAKRQFKKMANNDKNKNPPQFYDKEFRSQKRDMISRLASELSKYQSHEQKKDSSANENFSAPSHVNEKHAQVNQIKQVKTAFFGTFGDDRLCAYSDDSSTDDIE